MSEHSLWECKECNNRNHQLSDLVTERDQLRCELAEANRKLDEAIAGLKQIRLINNAPSCNAHATETLSKLNSSK